MHFFVRCCTPALRSLARAPLRSSLTTLGVVIGVGSVIAMFSIGNGAKTRVEEALLSSQGNVITVFAIPPHGVESEMSLAREVLTVADYRALRAGLPSATPMTSLMRINEGIAEIDGKSRKTEIIGVDVEAPAVLSRRVLRGSFFDAQAVDESRAVCVISAALARALFGSEDPIGRFVRIGDVALRVIGLIENERAPQLGTPTTIEGEQLMLPFTSVMQRLQQAGAPQLFVVIKTESFRKLSQLRKLILNILESRRGPRKLTFKAYTIEETVEAYTVQTRTMTRLLSAVGAISLIVGGIGIMNITLFSVRERTREIGIRLAIGTRPGDVSMLFLMEALLLALFGGAIGVMMGVAAASLVTYLNDWRMAVTPTSIAVALTCSAIIGIVFGYEPARRAARMSPIEALRTE